MKISDTNEQTALEILFPPFKLRSDVDVLYSEEKVVALEPNAVRVLRILIENRNRVVGKSELLDTVWRDVFTTDDVLKKAVSQIRRALDDDFKNPKYVETHHRRGYRFIAEVQDDSNIDASLCAQPATKNFVADIRAPLTDYVERIDADFDQFVGRRIETEMLQDEFRRTLRGGGQPILIVGEPGIGKTRLSAHFEHWAKTEQRAVCLRARFYDYEAARISSVDLFFDLLKEALGNLHQEKENLIGETSDLSVLAARLSIELPAEIFSFADKSHQISADVYRLVAPLAECFLAIAGASVRLNFR